MAKRILICDDDSELRGALAALLAGPYEIEEARDGEEALRRIEARSPDLVILDISMPRLSGLQTLKAYHQKHPVLPTIVLSAKHEIGIARRALALGARAYLTKPFEHETVLAEVARALEEEPETGRESAQGRPWRVEK